MIESNRMTAGSPAKHILKLAFPLMFGNIFQQLYTIVDTAVVGKALGVNALAALVYHKINIHKNITYGRNGNRLKRYFAVAHCPQDRSHHMVSKSYGYPAGSVESVVQTIKIAYDFLVLLAVFFPMLYILFSLNVHFFVLSN